MKYLFKRNSKTIAEINTAVKDGKLYPDQSYQRRRVWNEQDKVRLIETILLDYVVPEVFFWTTGRDPETGIAATHIVDGQQRISAISDFLAGEYALNEKYLLNQDIKNLCAKKHFSELAPELKTKIWDYPVSIVEIDTQCTISEIRELFYRLNLTNYSLNQQEKRNSKESVFGDKAEALSTFDFWKKIKLFSSTDAKRMKDIEYCCSIYILAKEGIVDQTNGKKINDYYDDFADSFDDDNKLNEIILNAMNIIENLIDKNTLSFLSKKAQIYTLFSVIFKMQENSMAFDGLFKRFKAFVVAYSNFRNELSVEYDDDIEAALFDDLKKYKLASSEGINKITNRTIRYEILYRICTYDEQTTVKLENLARDLEHRMNYFFDEKDDLEKDDLIDEE